MQMKRVVVALAVGLALVAVALGVTLSRSPLVVVRANPTLANGVIATTYSAAEACQGGETLPAGTSAIRLTLASDIGPRVGLRVLSGARVVTAGAVGDGWTGGSVTVPVRPLAHTLANVRICFKLGRGAESVEIVGVQTSPRVAAKGAKAKHCRVASKSNTCERDRARGGRSPRRWRGTWGSVTRRAAPGSRCSYLL